MGKVFKITDQWTDEKGILFYKFSSPFQSEECLLRVLMPNNQNQNTAIVFVLPVESKLNRKYGDGLEIIEKYKLQNKHNFIVVAPTFAQVPWYIDHPFDKNLQQETFFVKSIFSLTKQLLPEYSNKLFLSGFSKSGWGAFSLFLRHRSLFSGVAIWDATLFVLHAITSPIVRHIFGTEENFNRYSLHNQLVDHAPYLHDKKRIAILGYDYFAKDQKETHRMLNNLNIPHFCDDTLRMKHIWHKDWLTPALEYLRMMA